MSYIRSHQFAKTLLAVLLGLPFVLGVFSNARPAMPQDAWAPQVEQQPLTDNTALFGYIPVPNKPRA
jgi:hypothetical protein